MQLIAGPIVRYEDVEREISDRKSTFGGISSGITRFCVGLGKKVFIANQCGEIIGKIFDSKVADTTVFGTWFGMFLFALQIFFDFSGYSDMAIGLGRVFGFNYKENFNYPYISKSATEFWRRWHMSLGSFFRDYVYIPLGGNRRHRLFNIFAVWFLTGLWHGASWNFILWGLMYGVLISAEKALKGPLERLPKYLAPLSYVYMFFVTVIGWTVFYFTDMNSLGTALAAMFGIGGISFTNFFVNDLFLKNIYIIVIGVFLCLPVLENLFSKLRERNAYVSGAVEIVFNIAVIFVSTVIIEGSTYNPFLYFRF
ncbi:MAG: MBOAT family O-acyltransferase [Clostridia bacterium]|nr:MBOAT family O-acyltransferase [Clostridia bacterium]